MRVEYKGDEPIYTSDFLDDVINPRENYTVTFLGNFLPPGQDKEVDLYFVDYHSERSVDRVNAIYQFSDYGGDYGSGSTFMYSAVAKNTQNAYHEVYKRALEAGLIKEKEYLLGYSEKKSNEIFEAYAKTEYAKNQPSWSEFYDGIPDDISEEEEDRLEEEFSAKMKQYDTDYKKEHGSIPDNGLGVRFHIFDSLEEARKYCPEKHIGQFKKVKAINKEHLSHLGHYVYDFASAVSSAARAKEYRESMAKVKSGLSQSVKLIAPMVKSANQKVNRESTFSTDGLADFIELMKNEKYDNSNFQSWQQATLFGMKDLLEKAESVNTLVKEMVALESSMMDFDDEKEGYDEADYRGKEQDLKQLKGEILSIADSLKERNKGVQESMELMNEKLNKREQEGGLVY